MLKSSYERFTILQQKTEANERIVKRLDEFKRAIDENINNNFKQQSIEAEKKVLYDALAKNKNISKENFNKTMQQISDLTKQQKALSKSNFLALKSNKTIERHSALMNQSQHLLSRMQERELSAVGILEKARARMLNAKDAVTVSLIQNEVQTESRKYRKDLDMGQKTVTEKVTKQTEQQNTVANFYKNLSAHQKQEIVALLQKDTEVALVDGKKMTVKHTKKELTAEEEFNKSSAIENKEINKDRRKSKPLDNAQIREAQKAAEAEKQQEQSKGYQK